MKRSRSQEVPRIVSVLLLGVVAGLMLVLLHNQLREGNPKPIYRSWQAWVFFTTVVVLYVLYLKQHARLASRHLVDEKIRTHSLIECLPQAILVVDDEQKVMAANAAAGKLVGRDPADCLELPAASLVGEKGGLPVGQSRVTLPAGAATATVHPVAPERGTSGGAVIVLLMSSGTASPSSSATEGLRAALGALAAAPADPEALAGALLAADRAARSLPPPQASAVFPLGPVLEEALQAFAPVLPLRKLTVERSGEPALALRADRDRLKAALKELLRNAVACAPQGSAVSLSAERSGADVRIRLTNPGPAIPEASAGGAEGRGISLAREALSSAGGSLRLEGVAGKGTRATILLPGT